MSAALLIAPSSHHRLLWRHGAKEATLRAANRLSVTRSLFYDSPGKADGPRRKAQVANPLRTTFANWP